MLHGPDHADGNSKGTGDWRGPELTSSGQAPRSAASPALVPGSGDLLPGALQRGSQEGPSSTHTHPHNTNSRCPRRIAGAHSPPLSPFAAGLPAGGRDRRDRAALAHFVHVASGSQVPRPQLQARPDNLSPSPSDLQAKRGRQARLIWWGGQGAKLASWLLAESRTWLLQEGSFFGPDCAFPQSSPATGDGRRLGLDHCRRGSCKRATGGVCASESSRPLCDLAIKSVFCWRSRKATNARHACGLAYTVLTQRTAATRCSPSSRADSRPCAAQPRATCPARDHGDPMGPRSRRSSCLANQLSFVHHRRSPAQNSVSPESASRVTHGIWDDGPMGEWIWGGAENMEKTGNSTVTTTDSWQRPGRLPCVLASGWTPPTLLELDGSLGFPWMMARSTGSETPSPR